MAKVLIQGRYTHTQTTPGSTWTINHNLNVVTPVVDVWINDGGTLNQIMPTTVTCVTPNQVVITFPTASIGIAKIV